MKVALGVLLPGEADDADDIIERCLDETTRRFLNAISESLGCELSAIWSSVGPAHKSEFVALLAGADPLPVLEKLAETHARDWFRQLVPAPCGPGQGVHSMSRFPLPCFIEDSGFVDWLNGERPQRYAGLIARVEDAARLNFDHHVMCDGLCSITVPHTLTETVAQYLSALGASGWLIGDDH